MKEPEFSTANAVKEKRQGTLDDPETEESVESLHTRDEFRDNKTRRSDEASSEDEMSLNPGNYSEEDMSWLEAIDLEELEDKDFCITY